MLPARALRDLFEKLDKSKRRHTADVAELSLTDVAWTRAELGASSMRKAFEGRFTPDSLGAERRRAAAAKAAVLSPARAAAAAAALVTGARR